MGCLLRLRPSMGVATREPYKQRPLVYALHMLLHFEEQPNTFE